MPDLIVSKSKGRADPADLKLVELSNKGNYKQALADIEKRLKKGSSDRLLVCRPLADLACWLASSHSSR